MNNKLIASRLLHIAKTILTANDEIEIHVDGLDLWANPKTWLVRTSYLREDDREMVYSRYKSKNQPSARKFYEYVKANQDEIKKIGERGFYSFLQKHGFEFRRT
jgi:hypothetical protein